MAKITKRSTSKASTNGHKPQTRKSPQDPFGRVVVELDALHEQSNAYGDGKSALTSRVMEKNGKRWYEIREFVDSENYAGFTKRGVRLSLSSLKVLKEQWAEIIKTVKDTK